MATEQGAHRAPPPATRGMPGAAPVAGPRLVTPPALFYLGNKRSGQAGVSSFLGVSQGGSYKFPLAESLGGGGGCFILGVSGCPSPSSAQRHRPPASPR